MPSNPAGLLVPWDLCVIRPYDRIEMRVQNLKLHCYTPPAGRAGAQPQAGKSPIGLRCRNGSEITGTYTLPPFSSSTPPASGDLTPHFRGKRSEKQVAPNEESVGIPHRRRSTHCTSISKTLHTIGVGSLSAFVLPQELQRGFPAYHANQTMTLAKPHHCVSPLLFLTVTACAGSCTLSCYVHLLHYLCIFHFEFPALLRIVLLPLHLSSSTTNSPLPTSRS